MYYATPEQRAGIITGLRELADFLEAHPDVPTRYRLDIHLSVFGDNDSAAYAEVDRIAGLLGVEPGCGDEDYSVEMFFGSGRVAYRAMAISTARMARHYARCSYDDCVEPESTPAA